MLIIEKKTIRTVLIYRVDTPGSFMKPLVLFAILILIIMIGIEGVMVLFQYMMTNNGFMVVTLLLTPDVDMSYLKGREIN